MPSISRCPCAGSMDPDSAQRGRLDRSPRGHLPQALPQDCSFVAIFGELVRLTDMSIYLRLCLSVRPVSLRPSVCLAACRYVCLYVGMSVRMYVCMYVCMYVWMYGRMCDHR